ncbi:MAG: type IV secretion system protein, partial [Gammaproteobacteria bacterium]|nr:type IV secretion system protein [Gammaproteobacteria bacterium]
MSLEKSSQFYRSANDWIYDQYQSHSVWLRRALLALIGMAILLCLSMLSNLFLLPLKEKVPYLYAFDHATGEITKIGVLEPISLSNNWELSRFLLIHYAINREGYDADNIDMPYQMVWAQSADHVREQYEEEVKSGNVNSPYHLYGKDKYITVRVLSINKLNADTVDVKLEKTLHDREASLDKIIQKEAIIKWEFSSAETSQKMLDRDPLGFKVTYYQTTQ